MLEEKLFEPRNLTTLVVSYSVLGDYDRKKMVRLLKVFRSFASKVQFFVIPLIILCSCSPSLQLTPTGQHFLLQSRNKQFSCYTGGSNYVANCCYPHQAKIMLCWYQNASINSENGSIVIKIVPEN